MKLHDVQALPDTRGIALDEVGVRGLRYPIKVQTRDGGTQHTVADVSMAIDLDADVKGAHLSRFVEALAEQPCELSAQGCPELLARLRHSLGAKRISFELSFPYFIERQAPVTSARALMDYDCRLVTHASDDNVRNWLIVDVPIATVCPCSKAISDYGAHNQRGILTLTVRGADTRSNGSGAAWIEDLVEVAESCASSPVYPVLKRPDERHVTMRGYEKPVFVEDAVREAACALGEDGRIAWFAVEVSTDESIHNHAAYARYDAAGSNETGRTLG